MEGYDRRTYGERFADVYDEWYRGISDVETTVTDLDDLAGSGPVLELGVGTGRLAVPLARLGASRGVRVLGIDASPEMLEKLAEHDPDGLVDARCGDMVRDLPDGPFTLVFVAYNTLFNLTADGEQAALFRAVAERLTPGGRFVVEAFVPDDPPRSGDAISIHSMSADRVVLSLSRHDPIHRTAHGQFVELADDRPVRLRPWSIRYAPPAELDRLAEDAGLRLEARWAGFGALPYDDDADRHVSVYLRR